MATKDTFPPELRTMADLHISRFDSPEGPCIGVILAPDEDSARHFMHPLVSWENVRNVIGALLAGAMDAWGAPPDDMPGMLTIPLGGEDEDDDDDDEAPEGPTH